MELKGKMSRFSGYIEKAAKEVTNTINENMEGRLTTIMLNSIHSKMLEELPCILIEMEKKFLVAKTAEIDFELPCPHRECPKHYAVFTMNVFADYKSGLMAIVPSKIHSIQRSCRVKALQGWPA